MSLVSLTGTIIILTEELFYTLTARKELPVNRSLSLNPEVFQVFFCKASTSIIIFSENGLYFYHQYLVASLPQGATNTFLTLAFITHCMTLLLSPGISCFIIWNGCWLHPSILNSYSNTCLTQAFITCYIDQQCCWDKQKHASFFRKICQIYTIISNIWVHFTIHIWNVWIFCLAIAEAKFHLLVNQREARSFLPAALRAWASIIAINSDSFSSISPNFDWLYIRFTPSFIPALP